MPSKGVLVFKLEGQIAFASTYFCDLVGIKYDKVAGTSYLDYVFPDDIKVAETLLKPSELSHQTPLHFRLKTLDGTPVWVETQLTAIKESDGKVYALSAAVTATDQVA